MASEIILYNGVSKTIHLTLQDLTVLFFCIPIKIPNSTNIKITIRSEKN